MNLFDTHKHVYKHTCHSHNLVLSSFQPRTVTLTLSHIHSHTHRQSNERTQRASHSWVLMTEREGGRSTCCVNRPYFHTNQWSVKLSSGTHQWTSLVTHAMKLQAYTHTHTYTYVTSRHAGTENCNHLPFTLRRTHTHTHTNLRTHSQLAEDGTSRGWVSRQGYFHNKICCTHYCLKTSHL